MSLERYKSAFAKGLVLEQGVEMENLEYQGIDTWDSVGHMALIAEMEAEFEISMDMDDVIDFDSFQSGKVILAKYDISM